MRAAVVDFPLKITKRDRSTINIQQNMEAWCSADFTKDGGTQFFMPSDLQWAMDVVNSRMMGIPPRPGACCPCVQRRGRT